MPFGPVGDRRPRRAGWSGHRYEPADNRYGHLVGALYAEVAIQAFLGHYPRSCVSRTLRRPLPTRTHLPYPPRPPETLRWSRSARWLAAWPGSPRPRGGDWNLCPGFWLSRCRPPGQSNLLVYCRAAASPPVDAVSRFVELAETGLNHAFHPPGKRSDGWNSRKVAPQPRVCSVVAGYEGWLVRHCGGFGGVAGR